jgi:hypothetical protein
VSAEEQPRPGLSKRALALIAGLTAVVSLATGILTLRDQLFGGGDDKPAATTAEGADPAAITQDAEAKDRATRIVTALRGCVQKGRTYDECNTTGTLAIGVGIGQGRGLVEVEVTSPVTFVVTSRSDSGHDFVYGNTVQGELLRRCTPLGQGGCPDDGRW